MHHSRLPIRPGDANDRESVPRATDHQRTSDGRRLSRARSGDSELCNVRPRTADHLVLCQQRHRPSGNGCSRVIVAISTRAGDATEERARRHRTTVGLDAGDLHGCGARDQVRSRHGCNKVSEPHAVTLVLVPASTEKTIAITVVALRSIPAQVSRCSMCWHRRHRRRWEPRSGEGRSS